MLHWDGYRGEFGFPFEFSEGSGFRGGTPGAGWVHTNDADGDQYTISIDEADAKATISTNLAAASLPTALTVVTASQTITADGVDDATFDLDGEPNKAVTLQWQGTEEINKQSLTLDGSGDGSFTVGPYPAGRCTDANGFSVECRYTDETGDPVACTVIVSV